MVVQISALPLERTWDNKEDKIDPCLLLFLWNSAGNKIHNENFVLFSDIS